MFERILSLSYFGNTVSEYLTCIGIIIAASLIIKVLRAVFLNKLEKRAEKTKSKVLEFISTNIDKFIIPLLYLAAVYTGVTFLNLPRYLRRDFDIASIVITTFFTVRFIILLINYSIGYFFKARNEGETTSLKGISTFISIAAWFIGLMFLLDNLGFKISTVIAGLGIGGIAVALAAQAVLGDFFSYFVIFFDRPFEIGDYITVDDKQGIVEKIGIKTTRLTSLTGEEIIFPNSNLTNSRIHNFKRMESRRVVFKTIIQSQTPVQSLREIPGMLKDIIGKIEDAKFDRSNLQSLSDNKFSFETVYFVTGPDYKKYMDIQQAINIGICEEFEKRGIKTS
ncbi:MAG: mechanosensitive ion channel family protein [Syntrophomonadaceae bacterium]